MSTGEIIILIVYGIGYLITFLHQKKQIDSLKSVIDATSQFMGIFDIGKVREYVRLMEETYAAQKDKEVEAAIREVTKAQGTIDYYKDLAVNLLSISERLSRPLIDTEAIERATKHIKNETARILYSDVIKELKILKKERGLDDSKQAAYLRWLADSLQCPRWGAPSKE